jgi:hypothetical protein
MWVAVDKESGNRDSVCQKQSNGKGEHFWIPTPPRASYVTVGMQSSAVVLLKQINVSHLG